MTEEEEREDLDEPEDRPGPRDTEAGPGTSAEESPSGEIPDIGPAAGDLPPEPPGEEPAATGTEARGAGAEEFAAAAAEGAETDAEAAQALEPPQPAPGQPDPLAGEPRPAPEEGEPATGELLEPTPGELLEERATEAVEARAEAAEAERRPRGKRSERGEPGEEEVIPGAHLDPDLVLEDQPTEEEKYGAYVEEVSEQEPEQEPAPEPEPVEPEKEAPAPLARAPRDLAADARYCATGKRKTSVARVILRPGDGSYTVNGRSLEDFFPRPTLRQTVRAPLEAAGYESRMDVVARIHGGGVSGQAGALRHGVARALTEADPNLRGELKRRGFLTRDARAKERKKAGLKKARKRPQFSKR